MCIFNMQRLGQFFKIKCMSEYNILKSEELNSSERNKQNLEKQLIIYCSLA
ncbi:Uncharacterized protein dnm_068040 [Desulfonema magnum]|uniref:Uncharacterized protein n=1 Tax=Desulfonema magnum TaxID=45655 RepID=A0A975BSE0_9BACT|nr:Uncharacterized protein dnm_068040 [Desulfonema magnum]